MKLGRLLERDAPPLAVEVASCRQALDRGAGGERSGATASAGVRTREK